MKIVINKCYGGFSLSDKAILYMAKLGSEQAKKECEILYHKDGRPVKNSTYKDSHYGYVDGFDGPYKRTDPLLVRTVEDLGEDANGRFAKLRVIEIPDDIEYEINDYDGYESVHELHRSW